MKNGGHVELKQYLESRNLEYKEFASMVGCSPTTICNYIYGRRKPRLDIAKNIEVATKGKVTVEDLLEHWEAIKKEKVAKKG